MYGWWTLDCFTDHARHPITLLRHTHTWKEVKWNLWQRLSSVTLTCKLCCPGHPPQTETLCTRNINQTLAKYDSKMTYFSYCSCKKSSIVHRLASCPMRRLVWTFTSMPVRYGDRKHTLPDTTLLYLKKKMKTKRMEILKINHSCTIKILHKENSSHLPWWVQ